jgi:signal transduction histidine kinase
VCRSPLLINYNQAALHLYRIAQEAVQNAIRHGRAKTIKISLNAGNGRIILGIEDDGSGFNANASKSKGIGLRIMQYRAGKAGASLAVQRNPKGGVSVVCSLHKKALGRGSR